MKPDNGCKTVEVDSDRLTAVERDVGHLAKGLDKIETEVKEQGSAIASIDRSLSVLTVIAEQNQRLEPKLDQIIIQNKADNDKMGERVRVTERFIWKAIGAMAVLAALAPTLVPLVFKALGW